MSRQSTERSRSVQKSHMSEKQFDAEKQVQIVSFVKTNVAYYERQFEKIGNHAGFAWTFNFWAAILGSIWFGARGSQKNARAN